MSYEPPLTVTIPVPCDVPRARGIHSTGQFGDNMYVRITPEERELIAEEARLLGIVNAKGEGKIAPFVRWAAVYTANALRKERGDDRVVRILDGAGS